MDSTFGCAVANQSINAGYSAVVDEPMTKPRKHHQKKFLKFSRTLPLWRYLPANKKIEALQAEVTLIEAEIREYSGLTTTAHKNGAWSVADALWEKLELLWCDLLEAKACLAEARDHRGNSSIADQSGDP